MVSKRESWIATTLSKINPNTNLIISDLTQVSQVSKHLDIRQINIQHFHGIGTISMEDEIYRQLKKDYETWGEFIFIL